MPALAILGSLSPLAVADGGRAVLIALELATILLAAKLAGEVVERLLGQPAVLGELLAGIVIGPHALGGVSIPLLGGPLFPLAAGGAAIPVTPEVWSVAQLAAVVLLFLAGLETDFRMFLRYAFPGLLVGLGGVVGAFALGDAASVALGLAPGYLHPEALFLGTISVATSVGITARILSGMRKIDSPEGSTILAAAVIDDVLGIIVLAIVGAIATLDGAGGSVEWGAIGRIAARAVGFWVGATALMALLSRPIARGLEMLRGRGAAAAVALGVALLLAGVSEAFGLAMIVGAYIAGLALSRERVARDVVRDLEPFSHVIVPVFFCVMGMAVDVRSIGGALGFGLVYTALAIVGKVVGCGLPTLLVGFNARGALRVGVGMLPRGEVALIVAGAAIAHDPPYVRPDVLGVAILMTIVTTMLAPPLLVRTFGAGGSGLRRPEGNAGSVPPRPSAEISSDG